MYSDLFLVNGCQLLSLAFLNHTFVSIFWDSIPHILLAFRMSLLLQKRLMVLSTKDPVIFTFKDG